MNRWTRKLHRWGAVLIAAPLLLVIVTGLMLQLKKQVAWVQPPTQKGTPGPPGTSFGQILAMTQSIPERGVRTWDDITRLDVQPSKGIVKVQCANNWEVQLDLADATVRSSLYRRSDWIESLHDGSYFSQFAKLWIFFPSGLVLFLLWVTGAWLWYLPVRARQRKKYRDRTPQTN